MWLAIIGGGVVGSATGCGFRRLGHHIQVVDPKPDCLAAQRGLPVYDSGWRGEVDMVLVCTPETVIDKVALMLAEAPLKDEVPVFIRSSVPPGTCERLQRQYDRHFGHNPEFLRASVAEYEFLNPPGVIIGQCCPSHAARLVAIYEPLCVPIHLTTPATSELLKLAVNSYLATNVSYWNSITPIADSLGINSHEIGMLASHCDERVSVYGARMHGAPYQGACLPKDLAQLLTVTRSRGVPSPLLEAVKAVNDSLLKGVW